MSQWLPRDEHDSGVAGVLIPVAEMPQSNWQPCAAAPVMLDLMTNAYALRHMHGNHETVGAGNLCQASRKCVANLRARSQVDSSTATAAKLADGRIPRLDRTRAQTNFSIFPLRGKIEIG